MNNIQVENMVNLKGVVFYVINMQDLPPSKYIGRSEPIGGIIYDLWLCGGVRYATTNKNKGLERMNHLERILMNVCNVNECCNCFAKAECNEYRHMRNILES